MLGLVRINFSYIQSLYMDFGTVYRHYYIYDDELQVITVIMCHNLYYHIFITFINLINRRIIVFPLHFKFCGEFCTTAVS